MRRLTLALGVLATLAAVAPAHASDVPSPSSASASAPSPSPSHAPASASAPAPAGLAVVALPGATDAAWSLARSVYADPTLRDPAVDEAHARVLCGEPAEGTASPELRDLSDTVAAVRGEDAPSRALLDGIARRLDARALVVVRVDAGRATARVFLAETAAFDAATYAPDAAPSSTPAWSSTTRSLARAFGPTSSPGGPTSSPAGSPGPPLATREAPKVEEKSASHPFYESGWFWGAIGAAVLAGGVTYFATRDSSPSTIHLEVQVPH